MDEPKNFKKNVLNYVKEVTIYKQIYYFYDKIILRKLFLTN